MRRIGGPRSTLAVLVVMLAGCSNTTSEPSAVSVAMVDGVPELPADQYSLSLADELQTAQSVRMRVELT